MARPAGAHGAIDCRAIADAPLRTEGSLREGQAALTTFVVKQGPAAPPPSVNQRGGIIVNGLRRIELVSVFGKVGFSCAVDMRLNVGKELQEGVPLPLAGDDRVGSGGLASLPRECRHSTLGRR